MKEILTIAALDWRNGHEFALQAVQILKQRGQDFQYWIVGNGGFLEAVAFARHELGLDERVHLLLQTDERQVRELLRKTDVFLLAAVAPGGEHSLTRAIQHNLPLVITDLPQIVNQVPQNAICSIAPRRNAQSLADCLRMALSYADH